MFRKLSKTKGKKGSPESSFVRVRNYSPRRRFKRFFPIFAFLILVLAAWGAIFFLFSRPEFFSGNGEDGMALKIQTPGFIVSGESAVFFVSVYNNGLVDAAEADLVVDFPPGFVLLASRPEAASRSSGGAEWLVGEIPKNSKKVVEITGRLLGELGEKKPVKAVLNYKLAGLSAVFQTSASAEAEINSSALALAIKSPGRALKNELVDYEITAKNSGEDALENIRLTVDYPPDFVLESSEPEQKKNSLFSAGPDNYWLIDKLKKNAEAVFRLSGRFSGETGQFKELGVKVEAQDEQGNFQSLFRKENLVFLVEPGLSVVLKINGREESEQAADWDDVLDGELVFENKGDLEIEDISLKIGLTGVLDEVLDRGKMEAEAEGGNFKMENLDLGTEGEEIILSWDKEQEPELSLLESGDQGSVKFKLFLKSPPAGNNPAFSQYSFLAKAWAFGRLADFESPDSPKKSIQAEGGQALVKINTRIFLNVEVRDAISLGGESCQEIVWRLANSTNGVKNVKVSAVLPEWTRWLDESRVNLGQNLRFDEQTREITWNISRLPPYGGTGGSPAEAVFKVAASSGSLRDADGRAVLTGDIFLRGEDEFTGKNIFVRQGPARTE